MSHATQPSAVWTPASRLHRSAEGRQFSLKRFKSLPCWASYLQLTGSYGRIMVVQDVKWSCGTTRAEVRQRAKNLDISIAPDDALPTLMDIDTLQV